MSDESKSFSYIWKIKDFSFCRKKEFNYKSPNFMVRCSDIICTCDNDSKAPFHLMFQYGFGQLIVCYLELYTYDCPDCDCFSQYELDYELSFLAGDGSVIDSATFRCETFTSLEPRTVDENCSVLMATWNELFVSKKHLYLPDDTLTIRCRILKLQGRIPKPVNCFVETRISNQGRSIFGEIENFTLEPNSRNVVSVKSHNNKFISSMILCIDDNDQLHLEVQPVSYDPLAIYKCKVYIVNFFQDKMKFSDVEICDSQPLYIPLSISRSHLDENGDLMIPRNKLSLKLEILYTLHNNPYIIDGMVYDYDCQDMQPLITNVVSKDLISEENTTERFKSLKDDMIALFSEGTFCDMKLKTTTGTFPTHSVILSARSPVFKSMLTTDMKEKTMKCVTIEDLDADTVRQMLFFMYSDTVGNLDFEKALSLYFAADKYDIASLRLKCSNYLKENLLPSNCCDALLLADKHQDNDLKECVQDFIAKNDVAVFSSDKWINLEENFSRLTTEVFRAVYLKNRRIKKHL